MGGSWVVVVKWEREAILVLGIRVLREDILCLIFSVRMVRMRLGRGKVRIFFVGCRKCLVFGDESLYFWVVI